MEPRCGEYHRKFPRLREHPNKFKEYLRMKVTTFDYILVKIKDCLTKNWNNLHNRPIKEEERLVITIRLLCTGLSYRDMGHAFDVSKSIVGEILDETFQAIWEQLCRIHMQQPTADFLLDTAQDFFLKYDVPHCVGSVDVSHIHIKRPAHSGSLFFNYKRFYSVTLQGLVDAHCRFISIDVGGFGHQHDSTTFIFSKLYQGFVTGSLQFPDSDELYYSDVVAPYFFVGDGAYPFSRNLIKPYPGFNLTQEQKLFNRRISTARVTVERAFGLLKQTWRLFYRTLEYPPDKVEAVVKCACILHNVIINLEKMNGEPERALPNRHQTIQEVFTGNGEEVREKLMRFFLSN